MNAVFLCRASAEEGFGHLVRCQAMLDQKPEGVDAELVLLPSDRDIEADIVVFDMNGLPRCVFDEIRADLYVSLSPMFEHNSDVTMVFNRTKYWNGSPVSQLYAGLEYTVIGNHCRRIDDARYSRALNQNHIPVGINMGGDFWQTMANSALLVCRSGITPYEAAYAGIPSIVLTTGQNEFLVRELVEEGVAITMDSPDSLAEMLNAMTVDNLWQMRGNCRNLIDGHGGKRIWQVITGGN